MKARSWKVLVSSYFPCWPWTTAVIAISSNEDLELMAVALATMVQKKKKKRKHRIWVKELYQSRETDGKFLQIIFPPSLSFYLLLLFIHTLSLHSHFTFRDWRWGVTPPVRSAIWIDSLKMESYCCCLDQHLHRGVFIRWEILHPIFTSRRTVCYAMLCLIVMLDTWRD